MLRYTNEQLATLIAVPIVSILLVWTIAIFHKNRKKWGAYDIPIVAILVLSILRNLTILIYTVLITLYQNNINLDYCSLVVWIFNSVHTFQASALTTLAVIGLFSAKLHRKQQHLRHFLTATHVVYHFFCLTTLCACVGVAAILAQRNKPFLENLSEKYNQNPCNFMPYQLDVKFNVFIIVLHIFLAIVSITAFLIICYHHYKSKRNGFDYLKKSTSDLSDISLGLSFGSQNEAQQKNYYDTYTINKNQIDSSNYYDVQNGGQSYQNGYCNGAWNSDVSNISTTVSSTNSRRPCLNKQMKDEDENRTGLETIHPVLIVCYLFNHLPLVVLCIFPHLLAPWSVAGAALWLGLLQDVLVPISLGLVDTRFCKWISNVYRCTDRHSSDKLPHVGLDGKFRPFGSQPQSLEVMQQAPPERNPRGYQPTEHKFPITNGSLYTSIDGRLPVIHNYRRNKDQRGLKPVEGIGIHSSHLKRSQQNILDTSYQTCGNCEVDLCSSRSNLHHFNNRNMGYMSNLVVNRKQSLQKQISLSQGSLSQLPLPKTNESKLSRRSALRLSKSEDSLNEVQKEIKNFKNNPQLFQEQQQQQQKQSNFSLDYSSSDDDYYTDNLIDKNRNFDTLSSLSCYSITTEANCDFEFFQNNPVAQETKIFKTTSIQNGGKNEPKDFRITRSNSKRSLENFHAYIDESFYNAAASRQVQRSNSYATPEERIRNMKQSSRLINDKNRIKSVESLEQNNILYLDNAKQHYNKKRKHDSGIYCGSVPDFKKIFISEYI